MVGPLAGRVPTEQLITCIGNKRRLLDFVEEGVRRVRDRLGDRPLRIAELFAGSGVVSRLLKLHAAVLWVNDLEPFAAVAARCHLTDPASVPAALADLVAHIDARRLRTDLPEGFIARLYAPRDDTAIQPGERVFYTRANATILDNLRRTIAAEAPAGWRDLLVGPLLSEASIHANTSGVFKGFYKDRATGIGRFGGAGQDALGRILGEIRLRPPVVVPASCPVHVSCDDANRVAECLPPVDLAYLDPPYNQHPYGSNYFMLNLLASYEAPDPGRISDVSGIPDDWRRSRYNKARHAATALAELVATVPASFLLISYSDEGFVDGATFEEILGRHGRFSRLERPYPTFRGSRNLRARRQRVREWLYLLERRA